MSRPDNTPTADRLAAALAATFTPEQLDDLSTYLAVGYSPRDPRAPMLAALLDATERALVHGHRTAGHAAPDPTPPAAPWSWTPPPEPGPEVRRVRPVERYPGDNGIWIDRELDGSGWRIVILGRQVGGVIEWLQVVAAAGGVYGGRKLVDATAEQHDQAPAVGLAERGASSA